MNRAFGNPSGPIPSLAQIQAPDHRINPNCDTHLSVYHQLCPTNEQVKILRRKIPLRHRLRRRALRRDLARAVTEAANNILIADYCEAADEKFLHLLQEVGAAFLKLQSSGDHQRLAF